MNNLNVFNLLLKAKNKIENNNKEVSNYKHYLNIGSYNGYDQEFASFIVYNWKNEVIGCVRSEFYENDFKQSIRCFRMDSEYFIDYETPSEWFSDHGLLIENIGRFIYLLLETIE